MGGGPKDFEAIAKSTSDSYRNLSLKRTSLLKSTRKKFKKHGVKKK